MRKWHGMVLGAGLLAAGAFWWWRSASAPAGDRVVFWCEVQVYSHVVDYVGQILGNTTDTLVGAHFPLLIEPSRNRARLFYTILPTGSVRRAEWRLELKTEADAYQMIDHNFPYTYYDFRLDRQTGRFHLKHTSWNLGKYLEYRHASSGHCEPREPRTLEPPLPLP